MRLLIAAGGTGGHIYPALAVARSLRARAPDAPELRWLGGHRGLEATLVPAAGIPLRRLAARSLRTTERRRPRRPRPDPARRCPCPQATAILAARATGGDLHDRRLRRDPGPDGGRAARHPGRSCGTATSSRAARVRATARLAAALAVSFEATCRALAAPPRAGRAT